MKGDTKEMRSFRNLLGIVFLGIILVGGASPGRPQEEVKEITQEEVGKEERLRDKERILENESKILEKYAERLGVDVDTLADLRAKRFGYGEITNAVVLSKMTGRPLDEIIAMRESGKGWGQIANESGVKLREVRREVRREHRLISRELTREERRTLRNSWTVRPKPGRVAEPERPGYGKEKPGKEYEPPERGSGRGGGHGRGR